MTQTKIPFKEAMLSFSEPAQISKICTEEYSQNYYLLCEGMQTSIYLYLYLYIYLYKHTHTHIHMKERQRQVGQGRKGERKRHKVMDTGGREGSRKRRRNDKDEIKTERRRLTHCVSLVGIHYIDQPSLELTSLLASAPKCQA